MSLKIKKQDLTRIERMKEQSYLLSSIYYAFKRYVEKRTKDGKILEQEWDRFVRELRK